MSKRSEEAAYNYAKENGTLGYDYNQIYDAAKNGYEQAEKDLALTWEEAKKIVAAFFYVVETELIGPVLMEDEELYGKVLKRFNEQRKK